MTAAADADEVLAKLLSLSGHDHKLRRLDQDLTRAPASLRAKEDAITGANAHIAKFEDRLKVLKAQMNVRENEVQTFVDKINRLKEQSSEVRTNKEFVAFRSEIANAQADSEKLQNEVLKILDVVEQAEAKIIELKNNRDGAQAKIDEIRRKTAEQMSDVQKERDALAAGRKTMLEGIAKEHLATYERARLARGNAMATMEGAYCSGCGAQLTKNDMYAVQNRTRVVSCIPCNRILYVAGAVHAE